MSFLSYIKEGKFAKTNAMIVTALKEKTLSLIESEKLRVAASLFEDAPKAIHTDRTYGSHGAHLQDLGEPVGYTARHTNVPSPYAYSPTDTIHHWKGKHVFSRETSHKKFQTFEVPKDSKIHKNEDDASDEHIRKTYPNYERIKESEVREATAAPAMVPKAALPKPAPKPKAPAVAGKTGKWGKWSDNNEDRMPYDYSNYGSHPGARKSAISDFSEDEVHEDVNDDVPMHPLGSVLLKHGFKQHHPDASDLSYSKKDHFYKKDNHLVAVSKKGRAWAHYPQDGTGLKQGTGSRALDKHMKALGGK